MERKVRTVTYEEQRGTKWDVITRAEALKRWEKIMGEPMPNADEYSNFNLEEIYAGGLGISVRVRG